MLNKSWLSGRVHRFLQNWLCSKVKVMNAACSISYNHATGYLINHENVNFSAIMLNMWSWIRINGIVLASFQLTRLNICSLVVYYTNLFYSQIKNKRINFVWFRDSTFLSNMEYTYASIHEEFLLFRVLFSGGMIKHNISIIIAWLN